MGRKSKKNPRSARYMTESELTRRYRKLGDDITFSCEMMSLYVLHNTFGFGKKRMQRFLNALSEVAEDMVDHRVTLTDLMQVLKDECDYDCFPEK